MQTKNILFRRLFQKCAVCRMYGMPTLVSDISVRYALVSSALAGSTRFPRGHSLDAVQSDFDVASVCTDILPSVWYWH